jgi:hypothetical protein
MFYIIRYFRVRLGRNVFLFLSLLHTLTYSQNAPVTKIPSVNATAGSIVHIPVTVEGFTNISAVSLRIEYRADILTFDPGLTTTNPQLPGMVFNSSPVNGSSLVNKIMITWTGLTPVTFSTESTLISLAFNYISGNTGLTFNNVSNGGSDCEYANSCGIALNDVPSANYYINSNVTGVKLLQLNLVLEGLYEGNGTMHPALDEGGYHWGTGIADVLAVDLHEGNNYSTVVYTVNNAQLSTDGNTSIVVPTSYNGSYYIEIKNRNHITTVSSSPVSFDSSIIYYSLGNPSKAYGGNLYYSNDGQWLIFAGDENQDNIVDGTDLSDIENLAAIASGGYLPQDINGDGVVDGSDLSITGNNADLAIGAAVP